MSSTKAMVIDFDHQKIASFPQFRSALSNNSIEGYIDVAQFDISIPTYTFSITDSVLQQKLRFSRCLGSKTFYRKQRP